MQFVEGHGVLERIRFVDGTMSKYDRAYLVIDVMPEYIEVLNISSLKGKERKLAFPTNERLQKYKPPFLNPSFVKLDSRTKVSKRECVSLKILSMGETLDKGEFDRIKGLL